MISESFRRDFRMSDRFAAMHKALADLSVPVALIESMFI
jgi:hypothetical protein